MQEFQLFLYILYMESAPTSDITSFKERITQSFNKLFVQQDSRESIEEVVYALENEQPILSLCEEKNGSFCTIFQPFHAGSFDFQELASQYEFSRPFIEFCELCATIEGKTDTYAMYEEEPTQEEKEVLLLLLKRFLVILPSSEEFRGWLDEVEQA